MAGARPFGVSLITVIIVISGILGVLTGVLALLNFKDNVGLISGLVILAVGLIYVLVARGLWNGSGGARLIVAIVTVISLINGIWMLITVDGQQRWSGLGSAIVALIVLVILYSKRASAFFN